MIATSSGPRRWTRFFVRRSSFAAPVNSTKLLTLHGGQELLATEHTLKLLAPLDFPERRDPCVRRVAGDLFHPEVAFGAARDLGQMRDRENLSPSREPPERVPDRVRGVAADACVDLVEH